MAIHKSYEFSNWETKYDWGYGYSELRGTMVDIDKDTSMSGSSYDLLLWFILNNNMSDCFISINSLQFKNIENESNILNGINEKRAFRKGVDGKYVANFIFQNLSLIYGVHELELKYNLSEKCGSNIEESIVIVFEKKYSERKLTFWDTLMGI